MTVFTGFLAGVEEYLVLLFSQDGTLHVKLFRGCNYTVITGNYITQ